MAKLTNKGCEKGELKDIIKGKDIFIGVSRGNVVSSDMIASMADGAIVFAMANPTPEIYPEKALAAGAAVVGSGRSDFPNQVNNVLVFPGIFRGAVDCRAADISEAMKLAAAEAIAAVAAEDGLRPDYILPDAFDRRVTINVAAAVASKASDEGIAASPVTWEQEAIRAKSFMNKVSDN
jgi:malate dehydrogenase (oxaloacetate-decarboxylating)